MEHSLTQYKLWVYKNPTSLNPYSNGTLSDVEKKNFRSDLLRVLILILMEHSLT